jgi:Ca2+-binding EF-hand superfamily protein
MKLKTRFLAPLLALSTLGTAVAGIDFSVFTAADVDLSGSLSTSEFNTTLDAGLSLRAQARAFRSADANRDLSIQLNEFLLFDGTLDANTRLERRFYLADVAVDGSLTFEEFATTFRARFSLVNIRRLFLRADVDLNGSLTLQEYLDLRRGQTPQGQVYTIFQLADFNGNGEVTLAEFGNWFPQTASDVAIGVRFGRLDVDLNGVLTTTEWNPGVQ